MADLQDVSNVCSLLFSCEKKCKGNCKCGKEILRCWPLGGGANVAASAMIVHESFLLVNGECTQYITLYVLYI